MFRCNMEIFSSSKENQTPPSKKKIESSVAEWGLATFSKGSALKLAPVKWGSFEIEIEQLSTKNLTFCCSSFAIDICDRVIDSQR